MTKTRSSVRKLQKKKQKGMISFSAYGVNSVYLFTAYIQKNISLCVIARDL